MNNIYLKDYSRLFDALATVQDNMADHFSLASEWDSMPSVSDVGELSLRVYRWGEWMNVGEGSRSPHQQLTPQYLQFLTDVIDEQNDAVRDIEVYYQQVGTLYNILLILAKYRRPLGTES